MLVLSFDVGVVNLAYCIIDFQKTNQEVKIIHWEVISLENTKDHAKLYTTLIESLDSRKFLIDDIHTVLIEKQPSVNPKMRIIAGCLQTYFFIRGVVDSKTVKYVKFYSPKYKLHSYTSTKALHVTGSNKYLRTKKLGILVCESKLQDFNETEKLVFFKKHKKKDDLADSYLQAISYVLESHKNTPNTMIRDCVNTDSKRITLKEVRSLLIKLLTPEATSESLLAGLNGLDPHIIKDILTKIPDTTIHFPIDSISTFQSICKHYNISKKLMSISQIN